MQQPVSVQEHRLATFIAPIAPRVLLSVVFLNIVVLVLHVAIIPTHPAAIVVLLAMSVVLGLITLAVRRAVRYASIEWTGILGVAFMGVLATGVSLAFVTDRYSVLPALPYCVLLALASGVFCLRRRDFLLSQVFSMGPPVLILSQTTTTITTWVQLFQLIVPVTLVSTGLFILLRITTEQLFVANQLLEERARLDGLTRLLNRESWMHDAQHLFVETRDHEHPAALLFLDLDQFKSVNDRDGHAAGDNMLCRVADVLRQSATDHTVMGRYGGDEFVVLVTETLCTEVNQTIMKIHQHLESSEHRISVSMGVVFASGQDTFAEFIDRADKAMFQNKARKRRPPRPGSADHWLTLVNAKEIPRL